MDGHRVQKQLIMHRFHIDVSDQTLSRVPLSREETAHALRVLRMRDGDEAEALNGEGGAWRAILRVEGENAFVELKEPIENKEAPVRVTLYMGIPKGERLEIIVQKLTELGNAVVVPVRMERCVAKIDDRDAEKKLSRLQRIAQEAQKQCGRTREMEIAAPVDFRQAVQKIASHELALTLWEEADGYRLKDAYRENSGAKDLAFVVGPEGGISENEARETVRAGAKLVTLGPRILRAETAAIAGCSVIMSLWGDI